MLAKGKNKRSSRNRYRLKKNSKSGIRLSVFKSSKHLYAQIIDDDKGATVCSASTVKMSKNKNVCNMTNAKLIGEQIGKAAVDKGISKLYLDRGPNIYHGIVKTIADSARSTGLKF
ncbi:MAG: 50S ribosomal protein L18 [Pelagibacteraceae bacterium]|nr:50S ribosomal protein L18 [Pelagibacteraceae bacterium]